MPMRYLLDNAANGMRLIDSCVRHGVTRFVLSSTAALFNEPGDAPIPEDARIDPQSAYGDSKWMIERALRWAGQVHGLRSACLRYFNAAGADPAGRLGEDHRPESHLIPLVIDAALGRRAALEVYGDDYPTPDGTCIRDYVHVSDLATAHLLALRHLEQGSRRLEPRQWRRAFGQAGDRLGGAGQRAEGALPDRAAPGGGCGGAGRLVGAGAAGGLEAGAWRAGRYRRAPRSPGGRRIRMAMATERSGRSVACRPPRRCCCGRRCGTAIRSCSPIPERIFRRRFTSMPAGTARCSTACSCCRCTAR